MMHQQCWDPLPGSVGPTITKFKIQLEQQLSQQTRATNTPAATNLTWMGISNKAYVGMSD